MKNSKKRFLSLVATAAVIVSAFAGCGGTTESSTPGTSDSSATTVTEKKDSIVIATANETPSMHAYDHSAVAGDYMNDLTYSTLFRVNMDLEPEPLLVESYEILDDITWQFTLIDGVLFHDGTPLTSEDVKASFTYNKEFPAIITSTKYITDCTIIDDLTFTLTTDGPYAGLLSDLTSHGNAILPSELIEAGHDFNAEPIGSGPYKFVEWVLGDKVVFEAYEDYFLGEPAIKNMTWRVIPEGASRTIALEAGEIDAIVEVESMDAERISENPELKLYEIASTSHNYVMINNEVEPFDNILVRKALNYAIDREAILEVALNGLGIISPAQTPLLIPGTSTENTPTYDVEKAKAYLAEWGGDPSTIELPIICSDDTKRRAGEVIQACLAEIGITATLESMDLATYLSVTTDGDFVAAVGGLNSSTVLGYVKSVWGSDSIGASNKTRTNDPIIDEYIATANATLETEARTAVLEELSAYLNERSGQIPLNQPTMLRACNAKLMGFECEASGGMVYENLYWAE